jgi:hypothetical protein
MRLTSSLPGELIPLPSSGSIPELRAALKVLGRRFGLRAIEIRAEPESDQPHRRTSAQV